MIHIRSMTAGDVPLGMRLKEQSGWNQTEADWHRLLALWPEGCFVAELDGQPVGTTATSVFGSVGWISMVLVERSFRGRGVGTQLMRRALAHLDAGGATAVRLDATPLGQPIYARLDFAAQYGLARWTGVATAGQASAAVAPAAARHLDAVLELDRAVTGTDRRRLLLHLWQERPDGMYVAAESGKIAGYAWLRPGSQFAQIGPVVAQNENAGRALVETLLHRAVGRPVLLDIPVDNRPAMRWAESRGLAEQRRLTRMGRGAPIRDRSDQLWASFGPEKG